MIVTRHFVYIHTSRTGGTFLNKLIMEHVPGAQMIQYHGHLRDLPGDYAHLPVIGFVRNPWDWYVSMFFDYRRKQQYVYQIVSDRGVLGFEKTVSRFLNLGDNSDQSNRLLNQLTQIAPKVIHSQVHPRHRNPGLRSEHFENYPENIGYYSWLFQLMYESEYSHNIRIGRFENLREETLRLFKESGTPITDSIRTYLTETPRRNASPRPSVYSDRYSPELQQLVADKDKHMVDQFGYDFSLASNGSDYPKTDDFRLLGSADVDALVERVKSIPDAQWETEKAEKPNTFAKLDNARHVFFRFIEDPGNVFDFHDSPIWDEWKDGLLPIMEQAAQRLGYENYRFPRVMLAMLPAGGEISSHADLSASHYVHKIHVPLTTNPKTLFHVGRQARHLPVGEIVEVNNKRMHAVRNDGETDRVHLIFECYNMDDYGKRD